MEKEGQKSSGPSLLRVLSLLALSSCGLLGWQSQGLDKMDSSGKNILINQNSQQFFCCCLYYELHLIMVKLVNSLVISLKFEICSIAKFSADIIFSTNKSFFPN